MTGEDHNYSVSVFSKIYNKIGIQFGSCCKIIPSSLKMSSYLNLSLPYHLTGKKVSHKKTMKTTITVCNY